MQSHQSKNQSQRRLLFVQLLLLLLFISGCGEQPAQPNTGDSSQSKPVIQTTQTPKAATEVVSEPVSEGDEFVVLALGDSLTEGLGVAKDGNYPAQLEQALHAAGLTQVRVINSGLSGETSAGLLARVDWVLSQLQPDLTVLNIGANDAMRGLPLALTTQNIDTIIQRIQGAGSVVVLAGMQIYDNLGREYVAGFKDLYPQLADKHELTLIPFFLEHVAGDAQLNQNDLIHPTQAGYAIIVERNVMPVVQPVISRLMTTRQAAPQPDSNP